MAIFQNTNLMTLAIVVILISANFAFSSPTYGQAGTGGVLTLSIKTNGNINTNDFQVIVLNKQNTGQTFTEAGRFTQGWNFTVILKSGSFNVRVNQIPTGQDITNSGGVWRTGTCKGL